MLADRVKKLTDRIGIADVVGAYQPLIQTDTGFAAVCPFHPPLAAAKKGKPAPPDQTLLLRPDLNAFLCPVCGANGDSLAFLMRLKQIPFFDAVDRFKGFAERNAITLESTGAAAVKVVERECLYRVVALASHFYAGQLAKLANNAAAKKYLARREVRPETVGHYRLGFAPDKWDALASYLKRQQVPLELAEQLGLIRKRTKGEGYYDLFRNRLMFTICDAIGRPIGFGGRVLDDGEPKYINSPDSAIYHKEEVLFGLDVAWPLFRQQGAIVVEGYFDHLALFQHGFANAIATCGTALTDRHIAMLEQGCSRVYTLFDGDKAGKSATFKAMAKFFASPVEVFVVTLPDGEDPDSFLVKEGAAAFQARLEQAQPIFDYFLADFLANPELDLTRAKNRGLAAFQLAELAANIADPARRAAAIAKVAARLEVEPEPLLVMAGNPPPAKP